MCDHNHSLSFSDRQYIEASTLIDNSIIDQLYTLALTDQDKTKLKQLGFVRNTYEYPLTFAERKINLTNIEKTFNQVEQYLMDEIEKAVEEARAPYITKIKKLIKDKKYAELEGLSPQFDGQLAKLYADEMKSIFDIGKKTASDEMSIQVPPTSKDLSGIYLAQAQALEDKMTSDIANTATEEALYNIQRGATLAFTIEQIDRALDNKIQKIILASGTQAIGGAFNAGRLSVFETNKDRIYGFQYTAVLDRRTTNFCRSMSGRTIDKDSSDFYKLAPPNHSRCRSFWVEILNTEFIKPTIEQIPGSISRTRTGLNNFQDLQKIQEYTPTDNMTPDERRIQQVGLLTKLVTDLQAQGVGLRNP